MSVEPAGSREHHMPALPVKGTDGLEHSEFRASSRVTYANIRERLPRNGLERRWGMPREQQRLYLDHQEREQDLCDDREGLRGMRALP